MRWLAAIAFLLLCGEAFGAPRRDAGPTLGWPSVIAIDATSGDVLFERRADDVRPIASMTKLFAAIALRTRVDLRGDTKRPIVIALLGAKDKAARYDDYLAVLEAISSRAPYRGPSPPRRASASR